MTKQTEDAAELALMVKRGRELTSREHHLILVTKKIIDKLESGELPLLLSTVEAYRVCSRKGGPGARKIIRAVLRELGVDVSTGYRKIATMRIPDGRE